MPRSMTSLSPTTVDSFETSIKEASKTPHLFGCTKHGRSRFGKNGVGKVNYKLVLHVTKDNGFQHYPVQKTSKVSPRWLVDCCVWAFLQMMGAGPQTLHSVI